MHSTKIAQMVLLHKKGGSRALDKKFFGKTTFPEPLVQIQNDLTELFLMMPVTKP